MALKIGLLGKGISQSKMPLLQEYLGKIAGIEIKYALLDGAKNNFTDPVEQVKIAISNGFYGLNITHPYKLLIHNLVDAPYVDGHELIGSYNTLVFNKNTVIGANTDYCGFIKAYQRKLGEMHPGIVLLVGAGGVGRAIAMGLKELGCKKIYIYDVDTERAQSLVLLLKEYAVDGQVLSKEQIKPTLEKSDGLVNCTAQGMFDNPASAIDLSYVDQQKWAFDAVYTPFNTEFITYCEESGMQCISGFDLWFSQGLDAFKVFTGVDIPVDKKLLDTALSWFN